MGLLCVGLGWLRFDLIGTDRVGLGCILLDWVGLRWSRLDWDGMEFDVELHNTKPALKQRPIAENNP